MRNLIIFLMFGISIHLPAQQLAENDAAHPCITAAQYELIEQRMNANAKLLHLNTIHDQAKKAVSLAWPLRAAAGLHDCGYYHISAYVDHNTATGAFKDFNCGNNSYDGHRGTDISSWPYNFLKMDSNWVEVVAAAPGTILDKHDGEFDRNCSSNTLTANYVVIQHSDGSRALYWHMKKNQVTPKLIGQTVTTGELLGVVGASGSASGPHLHFEVWSGATVATRIDPYSGTCNLLNSTSWWTAQKPYKETSIVKASTHTTDVVVPPCPATETLNESNSFGIPFQGPGLAPGYAKFYIFLRDELSGSVANLSILNPDGSTHTSWTYTSAANTKTMMWGFSKKLPLVPGKYTFKAVYNWIGCSSTFDITMQTGIAQLDNDAGFNIYPNPSGGKFTIDVDDHKVGLDIEIYNIIGELVFLHNLTTMAKENQHEIQLDQNPGMYFYRLKNKDELIHSGKIAIE